MRRIVITAGVVLALSTALAAAAPPPRSATTGSSAVLVRISIPGETAVSLGELAWPTSTTVDVQSFQYPDDGSIVSLGRSRASVFAQPGEAAAAQSFAEVIVLSLFRGDVAAAQVTAARALAPGGQQLEAEEQARRESQQPAQPCREIAHTEDRCIARANRPCRVTGRNWP